MPTFDIVSEVDMQEVRNSVDQASRELGTRFDFRGVTASFELEEDAILIRAQEEFQIEQMEDILRDKLVRRKVDTGCLDPGGIEGSGSEKRRRYKIVQGIDRDQGKEIVKRVKESKLKVQASVQGEKIRITGKKRDDLQDVIAMLREAKLEIPLQFENFRD
jgi:cyclic-di-GMP-binding protein